MFCVTWQELARQTISYIFNASIPTAISKEPCFPLTPKPTFSDPATAKRLKCSACQASVIEMLYGILGKETEEMRPLKEVEIVEILERTCSKNMAEYG